MADIDLEPITARRIEPLATKIDLEAGEKIADKTAVTNAWDAFIQKTVQAGKTATVHIRITGFVKDA